MADPLAEFNAAIAAKPAQADPLAAFNEAIAAKPAQADPMAAFDQAIAAKPAMPFPSVTSIDRRTKTQFDQPSIPMEDMPGYKPNAKDPDQVPFWSDIGKAQIKLSGVDDPNAKSFVQNLIENYEGARDLTNQGAKEFAKAPLTNPGLLGAGKALLGAVGAGLSLPMAGWQTGVSQPIGRLDPILGQGLENAATVFPIPGLEGATLAKEARAVTPAAKAMAEFEHAASVTKAGEDAVAKAVEGPSTVRLYRFEPKTNTVAAVPEWIAQSDGYKNTMAATGRWFTDDKAEAEWYINEHPDGHVVYIDVPVGEAEKYRASNAPTNPDKNAAENPRAFSARPDKEFFVSPELAGQKKPLEVPKVEAKPQIGEATTTFDDLIPKTAKINDVPIKRWAENEKTFAPSNDESGTVVDTWEKRRTDGSLIGEPSDDPNKFSDPFAENDLGETLVKLPKYETGKPTLVDGFHGTPKVFEKFEAEKLGSSTGAPSASKGFFFARNPETAGAYVGAPEVKSAGGSKTDLFSLHGLLNNEMSGLNINGPQYTAEMLRDDFKNGMDTRDIADKIADHVYPNGATDWTRYLIQDALDRFVDNTVHNEGNAPNVQMARISLKNPLVYDFKGLSYREKSYNDLLAQAKKEGRDGAIFLNTTDGGPVDVIYVAFSPEQIRAKNNPEAWNLKQGLNKLQPSESRVPTPANDNPPPRPPEQAPPPPPSEPPQPPAGPPELPPSTPPAPTNSVEGVADSLYRAGRQGVDDKIQVMKALGELPKEVRSEAAMERIYRSMEGEKVDLSPAELDARERVVRPMLEDTQRIYQELRAKGLPEDELPELTEGYVPRRVVGKTPALDAFSGDTQELPQFNAPSRAKLPTERMTPSMNPRSIFTLVDETGGRKVVQATKGGFNVWNAGKPTLIKSNRELKPGETVQVAGKDWTVDNARTGEIEKQTGLEYHKNAFTVVSEAWRQMKSLERSTQFTEELKASPLGQQLMRPAGARDVPKDWKESLAPTLKGYRVDPRLREVIDDFMGAEKSPLWQRLTNVNNAITGNLFWSPVTHAANVVAHAFIGRSWDMWMHPIRGAETTAKAIGQVIGRGPVYREFLREGGTLRAPEVETSEFYSKLSKAFAQDVEKNPQSWAQIAKTVGLAPVEFYKTWMKWSNRALWDTDNVLKLQRYTELKGKGLSPREAIRKTEEDIPAYRLPSRILGSRSLTEAAQLPLVNFSRYHYDRFAAVARMIRDTINPKAPLETRIDAIGKIFNLAVLTTAIVPGINAGLQALTGNRGAKMNSPGPVTLVDAAHDIMVDKKGLNAAITQMITLSPISNMAIEAATNKYPWSGRDVIAPQGGPLESPLQTATQLGSAVANQFPMYQTATRALEDGPGQILGDALGIKLPTDRQQATQAAVPKYRGREEKSKLKSQLRSSDPLDMLYRTLRP